MGVRCYDCGDSDNLVCAECNGHAAFRKAADELAEAMGDFMHSHVRHCGGSLGDAEDRAVRALAAFEKAMEGGGSREGS